MWMDNAMADDDPRYGWVSARSALMFLAEERGARPEIIEDLANRQPRDMFVPGTPTIIESLLTEIQSGRWCARIEPLRGEPHPVQVDNDQGRMVLRGWLFDMIEYVPPCPSQGWPRGRLRLRLAEEAGRAAGALTIEEKAERLVREWVKTGRVNRDSRKDDVLADLRREFPTLFKRAWDRIRARLREDHPELFTLGAKRKGA
jgi:hypothetical protein